MRSVLFVCTGNICRSPTAEGLLRHKLLDMKLLDEFHVDSAATHSYNIGDPPDPRTVSVARENGVSLDNLRARKVRSSDFHTFKSILAMDRNHLQILRALAPAEHEGEIRLFLDYCPGLEGQEVPDPYYGDMKDFYRVYSMIDRGVEEFIKSAALP